MKILKSIKMTFIFGLALLLPLGPQLVAEQPKAEQPKAEQPNSQVFIEFADGDDILIIRNNKRLAFADPIGLELLNGDLIQTGKNTVLELRFFKDSRSGALLKMAQNTSLVLDKIALADNSIKLVYGRVRAKVEKITAANSFTVAGTLAVAGVRGTDFGIDVLASIEQSAGAISTITNTYCFEGIIEVKAFVRSEAQLSEALESIPRVYQLTNGEMLRVEGVANKVEAFKENASKEIINFWKLNDFHSSLSAQKAAPSKELVPEKIISDTVLVNDFDYTKVFESGRKEGYLAAIDEYKSQADINMLTIKKSAEKIEAQDKKIKLQTAGLVAGLSFAGFGGGLALAGLILLPDDAVLAKGLMQWAIASSASAIPFLSLSLFVNP